MVVELKTNLQGGGGGWAVDVSAMGSAQLAKKGRPGEACRIMVPMGMGRWSTTQIHGIFICIYRFG